MNDNIFFAGLLRIWFAFRLFQALLSSLSASFAPGRNVSMKRPFCPKNLTNLQQVLHNVLAATVRPFLAKTPGKPGRQTYHRVESALQQ